MGKRGPEQDPAALTVHPRAAHRVDPVRPDPTRGVPAQPKMSRRAGFVWRKLIALLEPLGVLTVADGATLARYCHMTLIVEDAFAFIDKHGTTQEVVGPQGQSRMVDVPQLKLIKELCPQLLTMEKEFGLTPSARTRVEVAPPEKAASKLDKYQRKVN